MTTAGIQPTVHVLMIRKVMRAALVFDKSFESLIESCNCYLLLNDTTNLWKVHYKVMLHTILPYLMFCRLSVLMLCATSRSLCQSSMWNLR